MQGKSPNDERGKSKSDNNSIPDHENAKVHKHISSFPTKESHYAGKSYCYLSADLKRKIMYELFRQAHPLSLIKYEYYVKIFNQEFDLHFGRLQVDACCEYEQLMVKIKNKILNAAFNNNLQKRRAKKKNVIMPSKKVRDCANKIKKFWY